MIGFIHTHQEDWFFIHLQENKLRNQMNIDLPFSLMKKTLLRVQINCIKCKTDILKAVAKLEGVNEITVDGDTGSLTVIGEVDPVLLAKQLRKSGKTA